jgi:hypothetical protein
MRLDVDPKKFGFGTDYLNAMRALAVSLPQDPAFYPYRWRSSDGCKSMIPAPRKFVQEKWRQQIVRFPAVDHFYDIGHYTTTMSYGAILEWKRSLLNMKRLQEAPGTITIRKIGMTIVALFDWMISMIIYLGR